MKRSKLPYWVKIARIFSDERREMDLRRETSFKKREMMDTIELKIISILEENDPKFDKTTFFINED
jgi:hypothetical protein